MPKAAEYIGLAAVAQDGEAIQYLIAKLKADMDVGLAAETLMRTHRLTFTFMSATVLTLASTHHDRFYTHEYTPHPCLHS